MPDEPRLTDSDLALLNKILEQCSKTEKLCSQCDSCGIDVGPERRKNAEQADIAAKLKATFFPHVS